MTVTIREARPEDEARWRELWAAYLAFYEVTVDADITDSTWRRVFDPASAIAMR
ncbi:GNAT family N-acetyltransferase, partial [Rhizobium ruizarguesonis]